MWIYHLEHHPQFQRPAETVLAAVEAGAFEGVISELTLLELSVGPLRLGRQDIADEYELLLDRFPHLVLQPVTRDILMRAASLRAEFGLRTPDAIHVATAYETNATAIVTNDAAWRKCPNIEVLLLSPAA